MIRIVFCCCGCCTVTTKFRQFNWTTITGADGVWRQTLTPVRGGESADIFFSSASGSAQLLDVLFGDVYLCGGQSNMQFALQAAFNGSAEIAAAQYPRMRIFTVGQNSGGSDKPLSDLSTVLQPWTSVTPQSVTNGNDFGYRVSFDVITAVS